MEKLVRKSSGNPPQKIRGENPRFRVRDDYNLTAHDSQTLPRINIARWEIYHLAYWISIEPKSHQTTKLDFGKSIL